TDKLGHPGGISCLFNWRGCPGQRLRSHLLVVVQFHSSGDAELIFLMLLFLIANACPVRPILTPLV
ncbi:hypothetical protein, partial [Klebsiella variicola]|uniref:hypothetical protein n=1 Tax=Klebsiella variicola TaxID=244366 RepID=UPI001A7E5AF3